MSLDVITHWFSLPPLSVLVSELGDGRLTPPPYHLCRVNGVPRFTCQKLKPWCTHLLALSGSFEALICSYFVISNPQPSSVHGADLPREFLIQRKLLSANVMDLPHARLWVPATQSIGPVVRPSHLFSNVSIPLRFHTSLSYSFTSYLANDTFIKQKNQQTTDCQVQFCLVGHHPHPRWLLGRLPAPVLQLRRRRNSMRASAACPLRARSRQQWSLRDVRVLYHGRMRRRQGIKLCSLQW